MILDIIKNYCDKDNWATRLINNKFLLIQEEFCEIIFYFDNFYDFEEQDYIRVCFYPSYDDCFQLDKIDDIWMIDKITPMTEENIQKKLRIISDNNKKHHGNFPVH
jgi:hypothetical protein